MKKIERIITDRSAITGTIITYYDCTNQRSYPVDWSPTYIQDFVANSKIEWFGREGNVDRFIHTPISDIGDVESWSVDYMESHDDDGIFHI